MKFKKWSMKMLAALTSAVLLCSTILPVLASDEQELPPIQAVSNTNLIADGQFQPTGSATPQSDLTKTSDESLRCASDQLPKVTADARVKEKTVQTTDRVLGEQKQIQVYNFDTQETDPITIELVYIDEHITVWRDAARPELLSDERAKQLGQVYESQIYDPLKDVFGDFSNTDVDGDGKTAFICYDLQGALGYFYSADMLAPDEEYSTGNHMDMLHLQASDNISDTDLFGTVAHELQHLISYGQVGYNSESWLNEAFSELAMEVTGFAQSAIDLEVSRITNYALKNGYTPPFIRLEMDSSEEAAAAYGQGYLFTQYLVRETQDLPGGGYDLFYKIFETGKCSLDALEKVLTDIGYLGKRVSNLQQLVSDYNVFLAELSCGQVENAELLGKIMLPAGFIPAELPNGGSAAFGILKSNSEAGQDIRVANTQLGLDMLTDAQMLKNEVEYGQGVEIVAQGAPADIRYTTDGSLPSLKNGETYENPVVITEPTVISAIAVPQGAGFVSNITQKLVAVRAGVVSASSKPGKIETGSTVTLSCATPGTEIRYTTDGSKPNQNSALYTDGIIVNEDIKLRAAAFFIGKNIDDGWKAGRSSTFDYYVKGVTEITLDKQELKLDQGQQYQLTAQIGPQDALDKTVLWSSDKPEVAAVDANGKITALSAGKAVITARAGDAVAQCVVTVASAAIAPGDNPTTGDPSIAYLLGFAAVGAVGIFASRKRTDQ